MLFCVVGSTLAPTSKDNLFSEKGSHILRNRYTVRIQRSSYNFENAVYQTALRCQSCPCFSTMLALNTFSMNDFPYASLLERSSDGSKKSFGHPQSFQINNPNVGAMEWKPEHFPHKMYDLLEDVERKGLDDIVSWLPDGKSFKIHSQIGFEQSIMPLYFSGMSSYKSFRRQLNLYGIYQHRHRPNQDANGK